MVMTANKAQTEFQIYDPSGETSELVVKVTDMREKLIDRLITSIKENGDYNETMTMLNQQLDEMAKIELTLDGLAVTATSLEDEIERYRRGLLSEVCLQVGMERMGCTIVRATRGEDAKNGIDFYAVPPTGIRADEVWAVQVKIVSGIDELVVEDVKSGHISKEFFMGTAKSQDTDRSIKAMLTYLRDPSDNPYMQHPEFEDHYMRGFVIYVPSGKEIPYKHTGEPYNKNFPNLLLAEIKKTF